jgi:hypothetical protein
MKVTVAAIVLAIPLAGGCEVVAAGLQGASAHPLGPNPPGNEPTGQSEPHRWRGALCFNDSQCMLGQVCLKDTLGGNGECVTGSH